MESIKKQGLRDLISKHERALPTLSNAVEQLRTAGLEISDNQMCGSKKKRMNTLSP